MSKALRGRPARKDSPKRVNVTLSLAAYQKLEKDSLLFPSKSAYLDTLIRQTLAKSLK